MSRLIFNALLGGTTTLESTDSASTFTITVPAENGTLLLKDPSGDATFRNITLTGAVLAGAWNGSTIAVPYGGTNITSYTTGDILYASATNVLSKLAAGTNGQVLTLAAGVPAWADDTSGVTSFSAGTTGFTPSTSTTGAVTLAGTLGVANGGTGLTSVTANRIPYGNGTSALQTSANLTFDGTTLTTTGVSDSGNLTFTGTSNRITGDFSNATVANRVLFQSSTTNSATVVGVIPNGTITNGQLRVYNNSDPTNAAAGILTAQAGFITLQSTIEGSGTYLPLTMYTGGSERLRIDTSGNVGIGTTSVIEKVTVNGSAVAGSYGSGYSLSTRIGLSGDGASNATVDMRRWTGVATNHGTGRIATESGGAMLFYTDSKSTDTFATTERMRIDSSGNVGIGTSSPSASALLDVQSTTKGVRMPNMTTTQKNAIASPAAGLMVYDTTLSKLCVYTTAWETITSL